MQPTEGVSPLQPESPAVVNFDLSQHSLDFSLEPGQTRTERPARVRLSYAEMTSVDSTAELLDIYRSRGVAFRDEAHFMRHIGRDWLVASRDKGETIGSVPLKAPVPLLEVTVDGQSYGILGVVHTFLLGSESLDAVSKTVARSRNWLHEQNLGAIFKIPKSRELKDHRVVTEYIKDMPVIDQMSAGAQMALGPFAYLIPGPNSPFDLIPEHDRLDKERDGEVALGSIGPLAALKKMAAVPEEIVASGELPAYIAIEYKLRHGIPLSHCQLRSAYMAEMLRNWDVQGDRHILAGRAHAAEIAYFLKHPLPEQKIQTLAAEHSKLLNENKSDKFPLAEAPTWNAPIFVGKIIGSAALWYAAWQIGSWISSSGIIPKLFHAVGF